MRKIVLFMMVSLDGYFEGPAHDLSWHNVDEEFNDFAAENLESADTLLFGRKTYQLMENYWPSRQGVEEDPLIADKMNSMQKIVFSRTLDHAAETENWKNIRLIKDNVIEEIEDLKKQQGRDMMVLGSNNLSITLLENGLLDEMRIMINPVVIGDGTTLFEGLKTRHKLKLKSHRTFTSGNILLYYKPLS